MRLNTLVEVSDKIAVTRIKKAKIALMADLLRQARGEETGLVAGMLSGRLRQGRFGIGWQTIRKATSDLPSSSSPISLAQLDAVFEDVAREKGSGSTERKIRHLREDSSDAGAGRGIL